MTEENKDEITFGIMDEDSRIVGKTHGKRDPKFQDEGFESENSEKDNNELESSVVSSAPDLSKSKWTEILEEVQPIAPILLHKFPSMTLRYKLIINKLEAAIRDLPFSQDLLPTYIKLCKSTIKFLQNQKRKELWDNMTDSEELEHLENSLKLLFSHMVSITIELNVDSEITRSEANYAANRNRKKADKNINIPVDQEQDGNKKNKLKTNHCNVDKSTNRWTEILKEIQPVAPILLKKFPMLAGRYKFILHVSKTMIQRLPFSKYELPTMARLIKHNLKILHKERKKGLWNDFANINAELEQLEDTLQFLFIINTPMV